MQLRRRIRTHLRGTRVLVFQIRRGAVDGAHRLLRLDGRRRDHHLCVRHIAQRTRPRVERLRRIARDHERVLRDPVHFGKFGGKSNRFRRYKLLLRFRAGDLCRLALIKRWSQRTAGKAEKFRTADPRRLQIICPEIPHVSKQRLVYCGTVVTVQHEIKCVVVKTIFIRVDSFKVFQALCTDICRRTVALCVRPHPFCAAPFQLLNAFVEEHRAVKADQRDLLPDIQVLKYAREGVYHPVLLLLAQQKELRAVDAQYARIVAVLEFNDITVYGRYRSQIAPVPLLTREHKQNDGIKFVVQPVIYLQEKQNTHEQRPADRNVIVVVKVGDEQQDEQRKAYR